MNFFEAVVSGFRNSFNFSGRASRSEFWFFALFCYLVMTGSGGVVEFLSPVASELLVSRDTRAVLGLVSFFILVAFLVPAIAIAVRRLHDLDRTGWSFLIKLTIIGIIWLLFWYCKKGTTGRNRFGADPLARA
jgi:uncharacterized membrane protein YhaH (DUF805 family)